MSRNSLGRPPRPVGRPSKAYLIAEAKAIARSLERMKAATKAAKARKAAPKKAAPKKATRRKAVHVTAFPATAARRPGRPRKNPAAQSLGRAGGAARTASQAAARRRNAKLGGRPSRICLHCLEPVTGGHRDRRLDDSCGQHSWLWKQRGLTVGDLRNAIQDEIVALSARLEGLAGAPAEAPAPEASAFLAKRKAPPAARAPEAAPDVATSAVPQAVGTAIDSAAMAMASQADDRATCATCGDAHGPDSDCAMAVSEAETEAEAIGTGPAAWRGYDHNGECLDCDNPGDAHAADCPYWQSGQAAIDAANPVATPVGS